MLSKNRLPAKLSCNVYCFWLVRSKMLLSIFSFCLAVLWNWVIVFIVWKMLKKKDKRRRGCCPVASWESSLHQPNGSASTCTSGLAGHWAVIVHAVSTADDAVVISTDNLSPKSPHLTHGTLTDSASVLLSWTMWKTATEGPWWYLKKKRHLRMNNTREADE